jgi:hypothetical protein
MLVCCSRANLRGSSCSEAATFKRDRPIGKFCLLRKIDLGKSPFAELLNDFEPEQFVLQVAAILLRLPSTVPPAGHRLP